MLEVTYQVDDGYVGTRTKTVRISESEFEDDMGDDERRGIIEEIVEQDFRERVGWFITNIREV